MAVKAIYPDNGDTDPEAVPGVRPELEGAADASALILDVDGETFALSPNEFGAPADRHCDLTPSATSPPPRPSRWLNGSRIEAPDPVPGPLFVQVPEPRSAKNRVHLD